MRRLIPFALVVFAASLSAQLSVKTIAPGMSRAKVVAVLGEPATARSVAEFTYLFYENSCAKRCGMDDLVVLHADTVVDAIFRSPSRRYAGKSSSPAPLAHRDVARATPASSTSATPRTRMKPPAEANDVRPSIPVNPPSVRPAPSTPPATRTP